MKTLLPKFLIVLLAIALMWVEQACAALVVTNISKAEFDAVPLNGQSSATKYVHQGDGDSPILWEYGSGPNKATSTIVGQSVWQRGVSYDFSLSYNMAGKLTVSLQGVSSLEYYPTTSLNSLLVGVRNTSGIPENSIALTNIQFTGSTGSLALPDMSAVTVNWAQSSVFSGVAIEGFDANQPWSISGKITFDSPLLETMSFNGGGVTFITTNFSTDFGAVPEPSSFLLVALTGTVLLLKRSRRSRWGLFL